MHAIDASARPEFGVCVFGLATVSAGRYATCIDLRILHKEEKAAPSHPSTATLDLRRNQYAFISPPPSPRRACLGAVHDAMANVGLGFFFFFSLPLPSLRDRCSARSSTDDTRRPKKRAKESTAIKPIQWKARRRARRPCRRAGLRVLLTWIRCRSALFGLSTKYRRPNAAVGSELSAQNDARAAADRASSLANSNIKSDRVGEWQKKRRNKSAQCQRQRIGQGSRQTRVLQWAFDETILTVGRQARPPTHRCSRSCRRRPGDVRPRQATAARQARRRQDVGEKSLLANMIFCLFAIVVAAWPSSSLATRL